MQHRYEMELAGRQLVLETGKLAQQANASVVCEYGGTIVLAAVVISNETRDVDFFPLQVEYEERLYAAGKIKSSRFMKREGRASDEAVLTGRVIDRSIRPLFDDSMRNEIQIVITVLQVDEVDTEVPALIAVSAALMMSNIPWNGPLSGVRVGRINGELVLNPSFEALAKSDLDLFVASTDKKVLMLEAGAQQVNEEVCFEAIEFAAKHNGKVCKLLEQIQSEIGIEKHRPSKIEKEEEEQEAELSEDIVKMTDQWLSENLSAELTDKTHRTKKERKVLLHALKERLDDFLKEKQVGKDKRKKALEILEFEAEKLIAQNVLNLGKRVDGRALDEIRNLQAEVSLFPRIHGSGLFQRGETQVLSMVTLGGPGDEQTLDGMVDVGKKRYMHHYNFPPYSVGEVKPMRGPGRREIGHGALAEKALVPVLPSKEDFPYTIRVVSEVLGSNGSSSMASTCGSSLALMDAGVPITAPVAGLAMGLASDEDGRYKILTDLQDLEDGNGGMDFKVAGTTTGITAIQLDTKTLGLTMEIVKETLQRAKVGRLQILEVMGKTIAQPRAELSQYAPRITTLHISPEKIRDVIGPGGKQINEIIDATGVTMDIEQDGTVLITSTNAEQAQKAADWVKRLTREVVVGDIFEGKVSRILDFGAFVEIAPRQDGMVHISELAPYRIQKVEDVVKVGQIVKAMVIAIDDMGRVNLSMKRVPGNNGDADEKKPQE